MKLTIEVTDCDDGSVDVGCWADDTNNSYDDATKSKALDMTSTILCQLQNMAGSKGIKTLRRNP